MRLASWNVNGLRAAMTKGFNGVVECFDDYIKNIQDLSANQILERQRSI